MSTLPDLEAEMHRLIAQAQAQGIFLRLLGGLAIKVQCPQTIHPALERKYPDIDFVTDKAGAKMLLSFLPEMGYIPNKTFNTWSGDRRQLWYDEAQGRQVDVFIGDFTMCHTLPLADRLDVEPLPSPRPLLRLDTAPVGADLPALRADARDRLARLFDEASAHERGPIVVDGREVLCPGRAVPRNVLGGEDRIHQLPIADDPEPDPIAPLGLYGPQHGQYLHQMRHAGV